MYLIRVGDIFEIIFLKLSLALSTHPRLPGSSVICRRSVFLFPFVTPLFCSLFVFHFTQMKDTTWSLTLYLTINFSNVEALLLQFTTVFCSCFLNHIIVCACVCAHTCTCTHMCVASSSQTISLLSKCSTIELLSQISSCFISCAIFPETQTHTHHSTTTNTNTKVDRCSNNFIKLHIFGI